MAKEKRNNYKFWHSPIALFSLFCVLVFFGYKIIDLIQKNIETSRKKELILDQIDRLQKRELLLSEDIKRLETEEGEEEIIREKYQVGKEGEKMVTIVDSNIEANLLNEEKYGDRGFWNWIKSIFKK